VRVSACVQNISESYERISTKFCGEVVHGPVRNRSDFGGDPDSFVDSGSFYRILYHLSKANVYLCWPRSSVQFSSIFSIVLKGKVSERPA